MLYSIKISTFPFSGLRNNNKIFFSTKVEINHEHFDTSYVISFTDLLSATVCESFAICYQSTQKTDNFSRFFFFSGLLSCSGTKPGNGTDHNTTRARA